MGENDKSGAWDCPEDIHEPANPLPLLQRWYLKQCDGNWEHSEGIKIETLDNPGWSIRISLEATRLEGKPFQRIEQTRTSDTDWMICWVEQNEWRGVGDPRKLNKILLLFLNWAADVAPGWPTLDSD